MNNKDNKLIFEAYDDGERAFQRSMDNDIRTADADERAERRFEQQVDREIDADDSKDTVEPHRLEGMFAQLLDIDKQLPVDVKKSADYEEVIYNLKRAISETIDELEIKLHNQ